MPPCTHMHKAVHVYTCTKRAYLREIFESEKLVSFVDFWTASKRVLSVMFAPKEPN